MPSINECLKEAMRIDGALAAAVVDSSSGMCLGTAGGAELDLEVAAAGDTELLRSKWRSLENLGYKQKVEDITIILTNELHIMITLTRDPNLFMYLLLKRDGCNLALAKRKLAMIERDLEL